MTSEEGVDSVAPATLEGMPDLSDDQARCLTSHFFMAGRGNTANGLEWNARSEDASQRTDLARMLSKCLFAQQISCVLRWAHLGSVVN